MSDSDFYEDDEPVADVLAAFDRGEKVVTARDEEWGFDVRRQEKVRIKHNRIVERQGVTISR